MDAIGRRLGDAYPQTNQGRNLIPQLYNFREFFIGRSATLIYQAMLGAVSFVLLIASPTSPTCCSRGRSADRARSPCGSRSVRDAGRSCGSFWSRRAALHGGWVVRVVVREVRVADLHAVGEWPECVGRHHQLVVRRHARLHDGLPSVRVPVSVSIASGISLDWHLPRGSAGSTSTVRSKTPRGARPEAGAGSISQVCS